MAISGLSGSMLEMYAETTIDARKDTRTMIDVQDTRAVTSAKQQMIMKDRANAEQMKRQLVETVKAGVQTAKAVGKVGEVSSKSAETKQVKENLQTAIETGDLAKIKQVEIADGKTVGDSLSDERIQHLLAAPGEKGAPATLEDKVARLQGEGNPRRANLRAAIESGDIDRIRSASISEHSTVGDTMSDDKIRELLAAKGEGGAALSLDQKTSSLMSTAQRREVTPETVRDKMLGELDRFAGLVMDKRKGDDEKGASAAAKNQGEIRARRGEMYGQLSQTEQDIARVAQLAADAHQPLVG